jgi:hypothetical protein
MILQESVPHLESSPRPKKSLMTKETLIATIQRVLGTDVDLSFLLLLKKQELETLLACIRAGMGK